MRESSALYVAHSFGPECAKPPPRGLRLLKIGRAKCLGLPSKAHNGGITKYKRPVTPSLALQEDWRILAFTRHMPSREAKDLEALILEAVKQTVGCWPRFLDMKKDVIEEAKRRRLSLPNSATSGLSEIVIFDPLPPEAPSETALCEFQWEKLRDSALMKIGRLPGLRMSVERSSAPAADAGPCSAWCAESGDPALCPRAASYRSQRAVPPTGPAFDFRIE